MSRELKGKLIVLEGIDGSGKATQSKLLFSYMEKEGIKVYRGTFPNYDSGSSALVKMYLKGEVGTNADVNAYGASTFFAADRYITFLNEWQKVYTNGYTIIADRYSTSNIVHQMSRIPLKEWDEFLAWIADFEYNKLKLPQPDLVVYLDMNPNTTQKLLSKRYNGDESKKDILEADFSYMFTCRKAAMYAAEKLGWKIIKCCDGENPYTEKKIHEMVKETVTQEALC